MLKPFVVAALAFGLLACAEPETVATPTPAQAVEARKLAETWVKQNTDKLAAILFAEVRVSPVVEQFLAEAPSLVRATTRAFLEEKLTEALAEGLPVSLAGEVEREPDDRYILRVIASKEARIHIPGMGPQWFFDISMPFVLLINLQERTVEAQPDLLGIMVEVSRYVLCTHPPPT